MTSAAPGIIIDGYELISEVGAGASSVVWKVKRGGEFFALKLMRPIDGSDVEDLKSRFRYEGSVIARMNHDNLIKVYSVGDFENWPYIIMELADGKSLSEVANEQKEPLSNEILLSFAKAIAGALGEISRHGLTHRDIKPDNVLLTKSNVFKLIDLGVAQDSSRTMDEAGGFYGTLNFASPEVIGVLKRPTDVRSDLYSLGVSIYELGTKSFPFLGENLNDVIKFHSSGIVEEPIVRNPSISPVLNRIILKLLQKDPDDRYQSPNSLAADVQNHDQLLKQFHESPEDFRLGKIDLYAMVSIQTPLAGRKYEVNLLTSNINKAKLGKGRFVLIEGEGGGGKSRLADEAVAIARKAGLYVMTTKCDSVASGTPLLFARRLFDDFIRQIKKDSAEVQNEVFGKIRESAGTSGEMIGQLSPMLAEVLGVKYGELARVEGLAQKQLFFNEASQFFVTLSRNLKGLLIKIDDIQWIDSSAREFMSLIRPKLSDAPCVFLFTSRNDNDSESNLRSFKEVVSGDCLDEIILQPMKIEDVAEMTCSMLGGHGLPQAAVDRLTSVANGNPFIVSEYVASLLTQGHLKFKDGNWEISAEGLNEINLSKNVYDLVLRRIDKLPKETIKIVSTAALCGAVFDSGFLNSALNLKEDELVSAIQDALRENLIIIADSRRYRFVHDRIREALISNISESDRRSLNNSLARTLDKIETRNQDEVFALARFYSDGDPDFDTPRLFASNLEAGLLALRNYSYETSYKFLVTAYSASSGIKLPDEKRADFLETLGRACIFSGRIDDAHRYIDEALTLNLSGFLKSTLFHLKTNAYAGAGLTGDAVTYFHEALRSVGKPYPTTIIGSIFTLLWTVFVYYFLEVSRVGAGKHGKDKTSKRYKLIKFLSDVYETSYINAYVRGSPLDLVLISFKQLYFGHFLGVSPEMARAHIAISMAYGLMGLKGPMNYHRVKAVDFANQLQDPALLAFVQARESYSIEFSGDVITGEKLALKCTPDVKRFLGSWIYSQHIAEVSHQFTNRGYSKRALDWALPELSLLDSTNNYVFMGNQRGLCIMELARTGRTHEIQKLQTEWNSIYERVKDAKYGLAYPDHCQIAILLDGGELGARVDKHIENWISFRIEDYHYKLTWAQIVLVRAEQLQIASDKDRRAAIRRLKFAILNGSFRLLTPVYKCHLMIGKAVLARIEGKVEAAEKFIEESYRLAKEADSIWGMFNVARERARIFKLKGDSVRAEMEVRLALSYCEEQSWILRAKLLENEFGVALSEVKASTSSTRVSGGIGAGTSQGRTNQGTQVGNRVTDALFKVSLASSSVVDPNEQAKRALDEIINVMGAERAFLFLVDEKTAQLEFHSGRDQKGTALTEIKGHSSTVIKKVFEEKKPIVLTGSDEMEAIGSKSAVIHDLRSIMAVPLVLNGVLKGAMYVDSRVAKGLFDHSDVEILSAIANHVAIAFEGTKMAQIEVAKKAMEKDLELSAAVQQFFLPATNSTTGEKASIAGFYRPATQCGGDWWWYEHKDRDRISFLVGDVTGHGAGSAMITASIAASFKAHLGQFGETAMGDVLMAVQNDLYEMVKGAYLMTYFAATIDLKSMNMKVWYGGAPYALLLHEGGEVEMLGVASTPLGSRDFELFEASFQLSKLDRLLIYTDGISEARLRKDEKRMFGERQVVKLAKQLKSKSAKESIYSFIEEVDKASDPKLQDDDYTLAIIDIL